MVIVNAQGQIVLVNSQTEVLFGYGRTELVGQPVEILIPPRFERLHVRHRASFLAEPQVRPMGAGLGLFGKRRNGTEFPVDIVSALANPTDFLHQRGPRHHRAQASRGWDQET
jgi:protein-histidine pros-kinase